jgi:hypothetical protein
MKKLTLLLIATLVLCLSSYAQNDDTHFLTSDYFIKYKVNGGKVATEFLDHQIKIIGTEYLYLSGGGKLIHAFKTIGYVNKKYDVANNLYYEHDAEAQGKSGYVTIRHYVNNDFIRIVFENHYYDFHISKYN